ncbi:MAG: peptidylprolyl isomerase [Candidatus Omnitrophica bacterium]|nr:peptidylprolyl isomerase [Candidatus Omnitrophota bacterium]
MPERARFVFSKVTLVFVAAFLFCAAPSAFTEVVDKILVIVNDEIITQGEVDRILIPIYIQYKNLYSGQELTEKLDEVRSNVVSRLVQDMLLLSEAKKREVVVTDEEVEQRIEEIKKNFSSEEEFERALAAEDIALGSLKKKHRERIMIDKIIDAEIRHKISVSPSELVEFYETNKEKFREPQKVKVKSILIKVSEERPEKKSLKLAKTVLRRLKEGGDFGLLAKEYSDGPYAESGGQMGWVREGELMDKLNDLVFSLDENETSGILKTKLGFHIFLVEEKEPSSTMDFNKAKPRVEQITLNKKIQDKLGQWIESLKKDAYIAFR